MKSAFKSFDYFRKTSEDHIRSTRTGGIVSICCAIVSLAPPPYNKTLLDHCLPNLLDVPRVPAAEDGTRLAHHHQPRRIGGADSRKPRPCVSQLPMPV